MPCRVVRLLRDCRSAAIVWGLTCLSTGNAAEAGAPGVMAVAHGARSGPGAGTLFATLPAAQTGIHARNSYDDPAMWREKYREFTYGAIGTGVAIGDFDGDGRPDVFLVGKTGGNHLFRNEGDFRFADVTARAGVGGPTDAWKTGVAFADVNNDGWLDLYVCRFGAPNLLYLNRGDGTFVEGARSAGLAVTDGSNMANFCDFDRDGWLDVFVQTNLLDPDRSPTGQRDYLFRNRGARDGVWAGFEESTAAAGVSGVSQGHGATWWDSNNDGWPDLHVGNDYGTPDQLYLNRGDGTFRDVVNLALPHLCHFSMGADLGDVDNDGWIDLFVADMAPTSHRQLHAGLLEMRALVAADPAGPLLAPQYMQNALFLNTGTGRCLEAAQLAGLAATDWTWSVRFEDLDNDGRIDLHVTNGMVRDFFNSDLRARRDRAPPAQQFRIITESPELREQNLTFRNRGDLQFEDVSAAWGLNQVGISFGAAFGDLDGDGDLDLVFANYQTGPTVARNDSPTGNRLTVSLRGTHSNRFGVGATVRVETAAGRQVRQLVLARGYMSTSEPMLHFGLGDDDVVRQLTVEWPSGQFQEFAGLAGNHHLTISEPREPAPVRAAANPPIPAGQFVASTLPVPAREPPFDELTTQPLLPIRQHRFGPGIAIGDVDGDGQDDLLVGGVVGRAAQLLLRSGQRGFVATRDDVFQPHAAVADAAPLIFDADGDGKSDLLLPKGGPVLPAGDRGYQPRLYLNQGIGFLAEAPAGALPDLPVSAGPAVVADFNRDGRLDVFIGGRVTPGDYGVIPRSALLLNRGGRFEDVTVALGPGLAEAGRVSGALWTDVDGDGWLDLLLAVTWGGIQCWRNEGGNRFEDWSERLGFAGAGTGWWNSIAAADFNGDGRLDYAAGNLGLNTRYRASPDRPALMYAGIFEDGGRPQLIEAQYEGDRVVPLRGLKQVGAAVRSVLRKFSSTNSYAMASLEEIVPPERLRAARALAATEFRSGVFVSQPDGTFRFSAFPRRAQIAPAFGLAAGDFDGDGAADVFLAQNSHAPVPEIGRFDGGLGQLLRGDGRGSFAPVPVLESGLLVVGDAKAVAVGDLDDNGWPDLLVTCNDGPTFTFLNRGVAGRESFGVMLRGRAGNRTAVGALVTVTLQDGSTSTLEVHAGGGYLGQSSAVLSFGYGKSNPPRELRVRWPSGAVSVVPWTGARPKLTIDEPSP